jgi:hypothetical protein
MARSVMPETTHGVRVAAIIVNDERCAIQILAASPTVKRRI